MTNTLPAPELSNGGRTTIRAVLVITGKGRPGGDFQSLHDDERGVLRRVVPMWLSLPDFRRVVWNTVVWLTIVGVSVRIVLGLALAFLLNSATLKRWRLSTVARILLIVPWATPPVVAIIV